jgi:hypothetical protein
MTRSRLALWFAVVFVAFLGAQGAHAQPVEPGPGEAGEATPGELGEAAPGEAAPGEAAPGEAAPGEAPVRPRTTVMDFGDEEAFGVGEVMASEDLRPIKRDSLLRKKFRGPDPGSIASEGEPESSRVAAGIRVGVGVVGFAGSGAAETDASLGGAIGAFLLYRVSRRLAIQPELGLDVRGALASGASRLVYVSVPVLARLMIPVGSVALSAGLGPRLDVSLTSRVGDADIERLDLGASAALGASLPVGLVFDMRYEHGFGDVIASSPSMSSGAVQSRGVSLSVGYIF